VIDAPQTTFLVATEEHTGSSMGAVVIEDAHVPIGVTEGYQVLA
jgi:hypothetical protein